MVLASHHGVRWEGERSAQLGTRAVSRECCSPVMNLIDIVPGGIEEESADPNFLSKEDFIGQQATHKQQYIWLYRTFHDKMETVHLTQDRIQ